MDRRGIAALALLVLLAGVAQAVQPVPLAFPSGPPRPGLLPEGAQVDEYGNAWITHGRGRPHRLLLTHRDVPGYVVSEVTSEGYLRLQRLGSASSLLVDQFMVGQRVEVFTANGKLPAVIACPSTHFRRGADLPVPEATVDDLWVDIGAESEQMAHEMGVSLLDPVVPLAPESREAPVGYGAGVFKACRAIGSIAKMWGDPRTGTTTFAWVSGGTEGGRGSLRLRESLADVDSVLILEPYSPPGVDTLWRTTFEHPGIEFAPGDTAHVGSVAWAEAWVSSADARYKGIRSIPSADARAWTAKGKPTIVVGLPVAYLGTHAEIVPPKLNPGWAQFLATPRAVQVNGADMPDWVLESPFDSPTWLGRLPRSGWIQPLLSPDRPHSGSMEVLAPLLLVQGVSQNERPVAEVVIHALGPDIGPFARLDERGNLVLAIGKGRPERLFVAHQDEIGYRLTAKDSDGRWRAEKKGGFYDWLYEGQLVAEGEFVVAPRTGYRSSPRPIIASPLLDSARPPATEASRFELPNVRLDPVRSSSSDRRGDDMAVLHVLARLGEHRVSARAIDDRYGCAALVMAAKELWPKRKSLPSNVWLVWSVEEEIGLNGATWLADSLLHHGMLPKRVHAVDTFVSSDSPLEDQRYGDAKLGQGAVVRAVDTSHEAPIEAVRATLKLAKDKDIPLQYGVTSGGNDGVPFAERGSINVPLAWPLRYSHSAVEVADLRDLESLARLVVALSKEKVSDDPAKP